MVFFLVLVLLAVRTVIVAATFSACNLVVVVDLALARAGVLVGVKPHTVKSKLLIVIILNVTKINKLNFQ
jgi:hypothetical protein